MAPQEYGVVKMKVVSSELANRRRDKRVEAPLINIQIDGLALSTIDWSLGGFLVEGYDGHLRAGDHATVEIVFEIDGKGFHNVAPIEVVRIEPYGNQLAANFTTLDDATMTTLEGLLTGRLRRQMMRQKAS